MTTSRTSAVSKPDLTHHDSRLDASLSRVVARRFLPDEVLASSHSRTRDIVDRVLAIPDAEIAPMAADLVENFGRRHDHIEDLFRGHAREVAHLPRADQVDPDRELVLGACFTAEYAVEGAALCNPSAVPHPDQTGLPPGSLRVAVALRSIGEGHISAITFAEAVIDAAGEWAFLERDAPLRTPVISDAVWQTAHLRACLLEDGHEGEVARELAVLLDLQATAAEVEEALRGFSRQVLTRREHHAQLERIRRTVSSAYRAEFPPSTRLSQRVLLPAAEEEQQGMEDARFTVFRHEDGSTDFRASYTAYSGTDIAPRLLVSPDLRSFETSRFSGAAAQNKGMALFPRLIGGAHLALTRTGGEKIYLARSADGLHWDESALLHSPTWPWEIVQIGNCGSPLETEEGWLVLIHGVGPMRTYSIGALLLDLDDPARVVAATAEPFLRPDDGRQDGYVPNVVYSCGAVVHDDRMFLPYGIGDVRIGVVSCPVPELISSMTRL